MGFNAQNIEIGKADLKLGLPSLSKEDCLLLLDIIRKASFKGEEMEPIFHLTLKIQNIFVILEKLEQ